MHGNITKPTIAEFEKRCSPEPNTGCWLWLGSYKPHRSGDRPVQSVGGRGMPAHRLSYMIAKGRIPPGALICHTCHTTECVNPDHLYAGTHQSNSDDKIRAGRASFQNPAHRHIYLAKAKLMNAALRAQTHCKRGHPLSGENVRIDGRGARACRACHAMHGRNYRRRSSNV